MKREIYYVTGNRGKYEEVATFFAQRAPEITIHAASDIDLMEEQTNDQLAIAMSKAREAYELLRKPVLVDDAGIYFGKYNKFPGTMTKFLVEGVGMEGVMKLFEEGDPAYYLLYLVYWDGHGDPHAFEGRCDGHLVKPTSLTAHPTLPYDDIFVPTGSDKNCAYLRAHDMLGGFMYRLRAAEKFLAWLKQQ